MVRAHLLIPRSLSLAVKHPAYIRHCLQIRERHRFESCREYQFKCISNCMLHLVISTPRSGSNALCRYLHQQTGAVNLYEIISDHYDLNGNLSKDIVFIFKKIMERSITEDLIVKCHIDHLMLLYPQHLDLLDRFLKQSTIYYCVRLNLADQLKSFISVERTGAFDHRDQHQTISISGSDALRIYSKILLEIGIQGELYKHYPGELMLLEEMSDDYKNSFSKKYNEVYTYSYDSEYTRKLVERPVNILEVFNKGNSLYSF